MRDNILNGCFVLIATPRLRLFTRRRPILAFSGHEGVSWKSWEATEYALQKLNTQRALPSAERLAIETRSHGTVPSTIPSRLLESADNGAKLIVP